MNAYLRRNNNTPPRGYIFFQLFYEYSGKSRMKILQSRHLCSTIVVRHRHTSCVRNTSSKGRASRMAGSGGKGGDQPAGDRAGRSGQRGRDRTARATSGASRGGRSASHYALHCCRKWRRARSCWNIRPR